jgi:hypothetical protein
MNHPADTASLEPSPVLRDAEFHGRNLRTLLPWRNWAPTSPEETMTMHSFTVNPNANTNPPSGGSLLVF